MKFEFTADKWRFILEAQPDPNYIPDSKFLTPDPEELDSWREGKSLFFQLTITSNKLEPEEGKINSMTHYTGGVLLSVDQEEAQEELEFILDQEGLLEHILKHWELHEESVGPEWR
jgi:hypothetical protein